MSSVYLLMPAVKLYKFGVRVFITRPTVYFYLYVAYILSVWMHIQSVLYICRVCMCVIRLCRCL